MQNQGPTGHAGTPGDQGLQPFNHARLFQGPIPPQDANVGDIWINQFDDTHVWGGYYWIKVQGPALEPVGLYKHIGNFNGHRVFYGSVPPPHAPNIYWVTGGKAFISIEKKVSTKNYPFSIPSAMWEEMLNGSELVQLMAFVAVTTNQTNQYDAPETILLPEQSTSEEAKEKMDAFEQAADLTGRLDVMKKNQQVKDGLIKQIEEETKKQYPQLTTKVIEDTIAEIFFKLKKDEPVIKYQHLDPLQRSTKDEEDDGLPF